MQEPHPENSVLEKLMDYLRYKEECGERTTELDEETAAALSGRTGRAAPGAAPGAARDTLSAVAAETAVCRKCGLCERRTRAVPGQGANDSPDVMFVGEAPGADEDLKGLAFVGRAGQLLTKMISAMGYSRDEVFISNICKCRPPGNRAPTAAEMAACIPFLKRQIAIVRPKTIVALGNTAALGLLGEAGITRLRGAWRSFEGRPLMPTYHPAFLLRCPGGKRDAWNDLQAVMAKVAEMKKAGAPQAGPR